MPYFPPQKPLPKGYINGLAANSNGSAGSIGAGECRDDSNTVDMVVPSFLSFNSGSWDSQAGSGILSLFIAQDPAGNQQMVSTYYPASPVLPSGYIYKRRVGYAFSSRYLRCAGHQAIGLIGMRYYYYPGVNQTDGSYKVLTDGTATTATSVDLQNLVPPPLGTGRRTIKLLSQFEGVSNGDAAHFYNGETGELSTAVMRHIGGAAVVTSQEFDFPVTDQTLKYKITHVGSTGAKLSLWVVGFYDTP